MNNRPAKNYTPAITKRFLLIMDEVLNEKRMTQGEFFESIGMKQQNLFRLKNNGAPTLEQVAMVCATYGYSPNWVLLGMGDKKYKYKPKEKKSLEDRVNELELDMAKIKRKSVKNP